MIQSKAIELQQACLRNCDCLMDFYVNQKEQYSSLIQRLAKSIKWLFRAMLIAIAVILMLVGFMGGLHMIGKLLIGAAVLDFMLILIFSAMREVMQIHMDACQSKVNDCLHDIMQLRKPPVSLDQHRDMFFVSWMERHYTRKLERLNREIREAHRVYGEPEKPKKVIRKPKVNGSDSWEAIGALASMTDDAADIFTDSGSH